MDVNLFPAIMHLFCAIPDSDNHSKIGPREFVVSLVTAASMSEKYRSIAALRRYFFECCSDGIARSSFWERLSTKRLTQYLCKLVAQLANLKVSSFLKDSNIAEQLGVKGIGLLDSSSITLPKSAKENFPAPRNNVVPSAAKWHLFFALVGDIKSWLCITDAATHDRKVFPPLDLLEGTLIIFDLGYWDHQLLLDLMANGCYFLSRIKDNSRITITALPTRTDWRLPLGKNLHEVNFAKFRGQIFEFIGELTTGSGEEFVARVVGFWNPASKRYHWYATNLGAQAHVLYPLYRIRWQIELQFKAAKSSLQLADAPSTNYRIIVNLLLASISASLLAVIFARNTLLQTTPKIQQSLSLQRAALVFKHYANELRLWLVKTRDSTLETLKAKILRFVDELVDPHYKKRANSMKHLVLLL